eukprot:CAMPEP_0198693992 /NCGR_PEP_ID=MMETSP1468-20131203/261017_1 /TAXON_ID=1461545 /ORGANISM="Mantoniella sp, Strain CCMP1436" /LENGTH=157 /DNA_ID=CAMNT_0044448937 /DNA_START=326 /DNA_END=796 /DNA_ORIENTATION=+
MRLIAEGLRIPRVRGRGVPLRSAGLGSSHAGTRTTQKPEQLPQPLAVEDTAYHPRILAHRDGSELGLLRKLERWDVRVRGEEQALSSLGGRYKGRRPSAPAAPADLSATSDLGPHLGDDVFLDFFDTRRTRGCDPAAAVFTARVAAPQRRVLAVAGA